MGANVQAGRRGWEVEPASAPGAVDPELEAETASVASFFDALPVEWKTYFDDEARRGREGYPGP